MILLLLSWLLFCVGLYFTGAEYGAQRALKMAFPDRVIWWDGVIGWVTVTALIGCVAGYTLAKLATACGGWV